MKTHRLVLPTLVAACAPALSLAHDHVVREWIGPISLAAGKARIEREILSSH